MSTQHIVTLGFAFNVSMIPTLGFHSDWYESIESPDDAVLELPPRTQLSELRVRGAEVSLPPRSFELTLKPGGRKV